MLPDIIDTVRSARRRILAYAMAVIVLSALMGTAIAGEVAGSVQTNSPEFYRSLVGDWVGVCEQSTDGEQAENKYFHVTVKETGPNAFTSTFKYYRSDVATGKPVPVGDTTAVTVIQPDGSIKNEIQGQGVIMVEKEPKQQSHKLSEVLTPTNSTTFAGKINGKISVSGLPFGLGKNGEISDGKSTYTLKGDTLTINQTIKAGFKILVYKRNFTVVANSTAKRGADVAALMKADQIAAKTQGQTAPGS